MNDLSSLPKPQSIEELDFEQVLEAIKAEVRARFAAIGLDFDTLIMESDPATMLLEAFAFREVLLRARINEVFRQTLLFYATGANLDQLAAWLDVYRLPGETNAQLKERYRLATIGRSAAGPSERYRAVALGSSADVRNVAVWREGRDPTVNVAVLSHSGNGTPTEALLSTVEAALMQPDVRVVSDTFNVMSAVQKTVDVEISVRLDPGAADSVADQVASNISTAWQQQSLLGLDLTRAFLIQAAGIGGVTNVEVISPSSDVVALESEAIGITSVSVTISGRGR